MKGFSLLELLIGLTLLSLLTLGCFSAYEMWYQKKVLMSAVSEFITALDLAKMLSTIHGETVYLCTSTDHQVCSTTWQGDLLLFTSSDPKQIQTILHTFAPIPSPIHFDFASFKQLPLYFMSHGEVSNNGSFYIDNGRQTLTFTLSATGILTQH